MPALERRLQVLLDDERFARLEAESKVTGRSIGAIVRGALDRHFQNADASESRRAAVAQLLAMTAHTSGTEPEWAETKQKLGADLTEHLERA